ncbi:transcriptional regulator, AraC family [Draconibacterium orientale]|uniref:Transcriptional regulator, AraC family n=1 Tax=Draconibacterium orientale TaxID=1168034 RepID=A0A1H9Y7C8_9BACT|nr:helix-turn-helix domain-containing protein [Draconibacterium orientale]SES64263.1 transcriptional regulator, AraC family [Draconibacterium orientale]
MEEILKFDTIKEYNLFNNNETMHPLVGIVDLSKADPRKARRLSYGFYTIFFKEINCGDLRYGCNYYDYDEGTLIFLAPNQVIGENKDYQYQPQGKALVFHPDFILGTSLGKKIHDYAFFSYDVNEALHLSIKEREIILDCFNKIDYELHQNMDKHTANLVISNIELFLNYCIRFYDRQFITRINVNQSILTRFDTLLNDYLHSYKTKESGLPTVAYFANLLHLSANYLGDTLKKETGKSAQEHIQLKLISVAKERIFDTGKSISEIAYELGYKSPQHFNRMFKKATGQTPNAYRNLN